MEYRRAMGMESSGKRDNIQNSLPVAKPFNMFERRGGQPGIDLGD
jgi:hypothetical protein